jgi:hypothetical protein
MLSNAKTIGSIAGLLVAVLASSARADCGHTWNDWSWEDYDLWNVVGCQAPFYSWHFQAYNLNADDWGPHGWNDACNPMLEYPKHWMSAFLLSYGYQNDVNTAFHSSVQDYTELARGMAPTNWHYNFRHLLGTDYSTYGDYQQRSNKIDLVRTFCPVYDYWVNAGWSGNPAFRSTTMVHEGTHLWLHRRGYNESHLSNPPGGSCTLSGANCDYWYWHGLGVFSFGEFYIENGTASRFHSPNQAKVEALCDLVDYPAWWVPASVLATAHSDADNYAENRFINGWGYHCGDYRPW